MGSDRRGKGAGSVVVDHTVLTPFVIGTAKAILIVGMDSRPNFLIVGAAKAGTSWVHQCLQEHPDVYVPDRKEIRFFSVNYEKGIEWYKTFFDGHSGESAVGEVSPTYMIHKEAHKRIYNFNPKVKLLFILRNPIERAYSHYCMNVRAGEATRKIDKEIKRGRRVVEDGMYLNKIERYLKFFDKDKIYIHVFGDLKKSPKKFIEKIYANLGVKEDFCPDILNEKYHSRKKVPAVQWIHNIGTYMLWVLKKIGAAKFVQEIRKSKITKIYNRLNDGREFPKMGEEKKKELESIYESQIEGLSKYIDRDLKKEWLSNNESY